jgi:hypothetical protein
MRLAATVAFVGIALTQAPASAAERGEETGGSDTFVLNGSQIAAEEATSLSPSQRTPTALAATTCWAGMTEKVSKNAAGSVRFHARMNIEWCASGGKVISNGLRYCSNLGGFLQFTGCTTSRGTLNLSSLSIYGDWNYRFGCCGLYTYYGANLDMRAYATGTYAGTWYWT